MKSAPTIASIVALVGGIASAIILIAAMHNTGTEVTAKTRVDAPAGIIDNITYDKSSLKTPTSAPIPEPEPEQKQEKPIIKAVDALKTASPEYGSSTPKTYDIPLDGDIQNYVLERCREYKLDPILVFAMIRVESTYRADVVSKTNDWGLMQINKCNHKSLSNLLGITNFLDPKQNILAGTYMLWDLREHYGCNTEEKLLMAYNRGVGAAKKLWSQGVYSNTYTQAVISAKKEIKKIT